MLASLLAPALCAVLVTPAACTDLDDVASGGQAVTLPPLETLTPGVVPRIDRRMQVNVVFLGYRQGNGPQQIDDARFRRLLHPFAATPGVDEAGNLFTSISFELDFNVVYAPSWYEDAFHSYAMQALGARQLQPFSFGPGTPALFVAPSQYLYDFCNDRQSAACNFDPSATRANRRQITSTRYIHGPAVESALAASLPLIGVDPKLPTVVLMNWYGRDDFVDHIYVKGNEPDVDTGAINGFDAYYFTRAWGGTASDDPEDGWAGRPVSRIYFHDLSAGPSMLGDWDLVASRSRTNDFPSSFGTQIRLPPIWEYGNVGYRAFDDLTSDLAEKVVNDIFVGALAFANPVYRTDLATPDLPSKVELDLNVFAWNPPFDPLSLWNEQIAMQSLNKLGYVFSVESTPAADSERLHDALASFDRAMLDPYAILASIYGGRVNTAAADLYFYFHDRGQPAGARRARRY